MTKKKMLCLGMAVLLSDWVVSANAELAPEIGGTSAEHPHAQVAMAAPLISLGGQYRINAYTLNDDDGAGNIAAARARFRQNIDLKFSEEFSTHLQINIGHVREGVGNHNLNQDNEPTVAIRHVIMSYKFSDAAILKAGLIPISDKFGDTLFSSDWDFNPVAFLVQGNAGFDYRLAWMKIEENGETDETAAGADTDNDMDAYLLDLGTNAGFANVGVMGLIIRTPENGIGVASDGYETNSWVGVRADGKAADINLHISAVNSNVDQSVTGANDDSNGWQLLAKIEGNAGILGWSLLGLYTTGSDDAEDSFFSPQSLYSGQGYWGKTGILNIQGPTDTGMDQNMLRTDNGGLGLTTIQASVSSPLANNLSGYVGAGWYQANEEDINGEDEIGTDLYVQVKYAFPNSPLALDAGVDIASLGKAAPNSNNDDRTATAVFARLQAEF